jgi:hypothetical protein
VLRNTDMTELAQVKAARAAGGGAPGEPVQTGKDLRGRDVLTASAPVAPLGWLVLRSCQSTKPMPRSTGRSSAPTPARWPMEWLRLLGRPKRARRLFATGPSLLAPTPTASGHAPPNLELAS